MKKNEKIYVAGHTGLVGSAIGRALVERGFNPIIRTSAELDLRCQTEVNAFFEQERPTCVFLAAAKVGGILANSQRPAEFIRDNLQIQTNIIDAAYRTGTTKLLALGSSCIYPRLAPQPIREDCLLTSSLEPTNEFYAIAKIAGLKMCQAYRRQFGFNAIGLMPTNLYGPNDSFDLESSHVIPALIRKFHEAKKAGAAQTTVWGTGSPRREFLHVDDLAAACLHLMDVYDEEGPINVGTGVDLSISELAALIKDVTGFKGKIRFDTSKPDGTPRKVLDISRLNATGWSHTIDLREGLEQTYAWFLENAPGA